MMRTILIANPDIDIVLGADTVVLGALAALREAGKARDGQFLGGIDGEPAAVEEIRRGGPYKASVSLASPVFAYAMGQQAADWLDGKSIPKRWIFCPRPLRCKTLPSMKPTSRIQLRSIEMISAATSISRCTAISVTTHAISI